MIKIETDSYGNEYWFGGEGEYEHVIYHDDDRFGVIVGACCECNDDPNCPTLMAIKVAAKFIEEFDNNYHTVKLGDDDYILEHPLIERLSGTLFDCDVNRHHFANGRPDYSSGFYKILNDGTWEAMDEA